ncbi:hypothetical protein [Halomonas sp. BC04]|uniref:hypothetical protein n=1 Tax=Halomonas sp. BC04 TaxID=1403540 RepID=UPI0003ED5C2C|nr:hypothetical protein Q427_00830 [Halomonas sp. BC04]
MNLEPLLEHVEPVGQIPPVDRWDPQQAGEMDLIIVATGAGFMKARSLDAHAWSGCCRRCCAASRTVIIIW